MILIIWFLKFVIIVQYTSNTHVQCTCVRLKIIPRSKYYISSTFVSLTKTTVIILYFISTTHIWWIVWQKSEIDSLLKIVFLRIKSKVSFLRVRRRVKEKHRSYFPLCVRPTSFFTKRRRMSTSFSISSAETDIVSTSSSESSNKNLIAFEKRRWDLFR